MQKNKLLIIIIIILLIVILGIIIIAKKKMNENIIDYENVQNNQEENLVEQNEEIEEEINNSFNELLIKKTFVKRNYLISPYSIEMALNMLKEGANNETYEELNKVLNSRNINHLNYDNLKVANALFVKNVYQNKIVQSYQDKLKKDYDADILTLEFKSPDIINNWVKEKTEGMIPKILETLPSDFVLGLANAIYLDAKWNNQFDCHNTISKEFNKIDGGKINVEMMHNTYTSNKYRYLDTDNLKGIILPYKIENDSALEFIALLPNNLDNFIKELSDDKLNDFLSKMKSIDNNERVRLSLPRFTYEYEIEDFISVLKSLGLSKMFSLDADFSKMIKDEKVYIDEAIHKTKIELNESGTKAAAVTYFGMKNTAYNQDMKDIYITFDKPFIYLIRDTKTKELLFFGSVYEPNLWTKTTCE